MNANNEVKSHSHNPFLESKVMHIVSEYYIDYIKNLSSFIIICKLFAVNLRDLHHYSKKLSL